MAGSNILAAASAAPKVLYSGQLTATTDTQIYAPPAGGSAVLKHGTICNTSGSAVTITSIRIIPNGGAVDGTHLAISNYSLGANDTLFLTDFLSSCCLGPGDSIHVQVGTANVVDVVITGIENT